MIEYYLILLGELLNSKLYFKLLNFNLCGFGYSRYPPAIHANITCIGIRIFFADLDANPNMKISMRILI